MKPHTKKWRAVPSTLHSSNPASVRMDIVDDGAEFSPAFVAGDIMPEDARLMAAAPELISELERVVEELHELIKDERDDPSVGISGWNSLHESVADARAVIAKAKGRP